MTRILFAGTPDIAVPSLRALAGDGSFKIGVLTNPDAPAGRSREALPSPVKAEALSLGLEVFSPWKLDGAFRETQRDRWDLLISFAYGKIFGPLFLSLFPKGGINVHPSLLPRWRGPSPLNAALVAGDRTTGLSLQTLALKMDEGDILYQETWELTGSETAGTLGEKAAVRAAEVLPDRVKKYLLNEIVPVPQREENATYCTLLKKDDGLIDWSQTAQEIHCKIRGYNPWPGAYTYLNGQKLNVWEASPVSVDTSASRAGEIADLDKKEGILVKTGQGTLALRQLQLASKKVMDFRSFANGQGNLKGLVLG